MRTFQTLFYGLFLTIIFSHLYTKPTFPTWSNWYQSLLQHYPQKSSAKELIWLEQAFHHPLYPEQLNQHLDYFFWLTPAEKKKVSSFSPHQPNKTNPFDSASPTSWQLLRPFLKVKKFPNPTTYLNHKKKPSIRAGFTVKSSRIKQPIDVFKVLKNYSLKNYIQYQDPWVKFHVLWDRDPNEYKVFDLLKWSSRLNLFTRYSQNLNFYFGALKVNFGQRLLLSTAYPLEISIDNPFKIRESTYHLFKSLPGNLIDIDKGGNEIYLNGAALSVKTNNWQAVVGVGRYQYEDTLKTQTNANNSSPLDSRDTRYIQYAEKITTTASYHELPLAPTQDRLSETLYFLHLEKLFTANLFYVDPYFYQGKLGLSLIYSMLSHPVYPTSNDFYGKNYWGTSLNFAWRPPLKRTSLDDKLIDYWELFGELSLLGNQDKNNKGFNYHLAFAGGVILRLPTSKILFHYREIPKGYHAPHQMNYTKKSTKNNERGFYFSYDLKVPSPIKWQWFVDTYFPIESETPTYKYSEIEMQHALKYTFKLHYFIETKLGFKTSPTDLSYNTALTYGYRWRSLKTISWSSITHQTKLVGHLKSNYAPTWLTRLKLTLNHQPRNSHSSTTKTTRKTAFELGLVGTSSHNSKAIYTYFYHNPHFSENIYFNQSALFFLIRHQTTLPITSSTLSRFSKITLGFSLGMKTQSTEKERLFYLKPTHVFFLSLYLDYLY